MQILYTSDIHASPSHLDALMERAARSDVDALIIGGDIVPHYLPAEYPRNPVAAQAHYIRDKLLPVLRKLKKKHPVKIYLDLGNDDFIAGRSLLTACEPDLLHLLHMSRHPLTDEVDVVGYMMVPPTPFQRKDWEKPDSSGQPHAPGARVVLDGFRTRQAGLRPATLDLNSADTIESDLAQLECEITRPFIFVSHTPPFDTPLDVIYSGNHVGSSSVRRFIQRWADKGLLIAALHGHIHESYLRSGAIETRIGNALCINPGQTSGPGEKLRFVRLGLETGPGRPNVVLHPCC